MTTIGVTPEQFAEKIKKLERENEKLKDSIRAIGIKNKTLENEKSVSHKTLEVYSENQNLRQENREKKECIEFVFAILRDSYCQEYINGRTFEKLKEATEACRKLLQNTGKSDGKVD